MNGKHREPISKNFYKGKPIKHPECIRMLTLNRRSVYNPNWGIKPAAIIESMQFRVVMNLIEQGKLYNIVEKKDATKKREIKNARNKIQRQRGR